MKLVISSAQHIGSRSQQQDAFAVPESNDTFFQHAGHLVIVADGMGGLAHGDLASRVAVDAFIQAWNQKTAAEAPADALVRCILQANRAVNQAAIEQSTCGDMGTTLIAGSFLPQADGSITLSWISAGDSGIFVQSRDKFAQINTPHTLATFLDEQVAKGAIPKQAAEAHPERESLISFLGLDTIALIDRNTSPLRIEPGDIVLFASDGLFKFLPTPAIQATLSGDARNFSTNLVDKTIAAKLPHQDNVTAVTVSAPGTPTARKTTLASVALLASALAGGFLWKRTRKSKDGPVPGSGSGPSSPAESEGAP